MMRPMIRFAGVLLGTAENPGAELERNQVTQRHPGQPVSHLADCEVMGGSARANAPSLGHFHQTQLLGARGAQPTPTNPTLECSSIAHQRAT